MRNLPNWIARIAFLTAFVTTLSASIVAAGTRNESSGLRVHTRQGIAQGMLVGKVEEFRGLPYAAPPVGDLRWRAPAPPKAYEGVVQATTFPAPCVQGRALPAFPAPSEDCLYLNLYRPAGSNPQRKMPVLIYFHGGGFAGGTASAREGGQLAAGNDMIVIMINYRLGAFGWLALSGLDAETENKSSSGNYGLLDMLAALRWVQENIAAFGGNSRNVTIAGTSAGGIGVCALMTAKMEDRPFQRSIIESGECSRSSGYITTHEAALLEGAKFAAKASCTDPRTFSSCLRSKPAPALLAASAGLDISKANIGGNLMPVEPIQVIESGGMDRIPVIVGANHDEQMSSPLETTGFPANEQSYYKYLANAFGPLAPLVAVEYPASAFKDPAYAAGAAAGDSGIPNGIGVCPMLAEVGGALAKTTQAFAYELDDPHGSEVKNYAGFEAGSMHTAEIQFLYPPDGPDKHSPEEERMSIRMQHYWASFARSGRPSDGHNQWPALQPGSGSILRFQPDGDVIVPSTKLSEEHHCDFWTGLGY